MVKEGGEGAHICHHRSGTNATLAQLYWKKSKRPMSVRGGTECGASEAMQVDRRRQGTHAGTVSAGHDVV